MCLRMLANQASDPRCSLSLTLHLERWPNQAVLAFHSQPQPSRRLTRNLRLLQPRLEWLSRSSVLAAALKPKLHRRVEGIGLQV